MEQKINKIIQTATQQLGDDADVLVITHKAMKCGCSIHGNENKIAEAIFALMHSDNLEIKSGLYRIIKNIMLNILGNESPYTLDLAEAFLNALDNVTLDKTAAKIISLNPNAQNNE